MSEVKKRGFDLSIDLTTKTSILLLSFLALSLLFSSSSSLTSPEVVSRVSEKYGGLKSISFAFTEKEVLPEGGENLVAKGRVWAKMPQMFKVEYGFPEGKTLISDGVKLFIQFPGEEPFMVLVEGGMEASPGLFFLEFLKSGEFELSGEESVEKHNCIKLSGKFKGEGIPPTVSLWVDKKLWIVRQVAAEEAGGRIQKFVLSTITLNPNLSSEVFALP